MKIIYSIALALAIVILNVAPGAEAQSSPELVLTWRAETYAPDWFEGKKMVSPNSEVHVFFEVINGNKPVSLTQETIYWYLNGQLIENSPGVQKITLKAPGNAGGVLRVRVQLPDFQGRILSKSVDIPVVRPEAVIFSPYTENMTSESKLSLHALPFFFNALSLYEMDFVWKANGELAENGVTPEILSINIPAESSSADIKVDLRIDHESGAATDVLNLKYSR